MSYFFKLFYISFRYVVQWLYMCITYEVILITLALTCLYT